MEAQDQPNSDQIAFWNGDAGQRWVDDQEAMDATLEPFGEAAMEALGVPKGGEVIDLGCGCGGTTLELARRTGPMGRVLGIDISTPMLGRARERASAASLGHTLFVNTDASTYRFEAQAFDCAFSRFGVMFFDRPAAAFANIRKALRPGGRLGFACWRALAENEWVTLARDVALRHVAPLEPARPGAPGPFAFAEPAHVASVLGRAGFTGITLRPVDHAMRHAGEVAEIAATMARMGPASRLIADAPENVRGRIVEDLAEAIAPRYDGKAIDLAAAAWIVTANA